jgi:uncharacterized membrane protein YqiK
MQNNEPVKTFLSQFSRAIPQMKEDSVGSAVLIQQGNLKAAMQKLHPVVANLQSLMEGIRIIMSAGIVDFNALSVNGKTFAQSRDSLAAFLKQLSAHIRESKHVELADSLEYELPPILGEWELIVRELQAKY